MPVSTRTVRIQPYSDADQNYAPLVDFIRGILVILQYNPFPIIPTEQSGAWEKTDDYSHPQSGWQYGDEVGIKVTLNEVLEPKADGIAVSGVTVETFGLNDGNSLKITCERSWFDPRYIELQVEGTESAVEEIVSAFQKQFGEAPPLTAAETSNELLEAEMSIRGGAWDAARIHADAVLKQEPDNGQAHFFMGVALGATGNYGKALPHLLKATEADPSNYDAWYNLANVYLEQAQYDKAVEQFRHALEISPDNHPAYYRMALAFEMAGNKKEAIAANKDAVRTAPNPDQAWGYRGMDFEPAAKQALLRLEK